jgi:hypothetical protein
MSLILIRYNQEEILCQNDADYFHKWGYKSEDERMRLLSGNMIEK